ncbi:glycosyltransferase [Crossiella sp. SN42]|uniref:glycosyltransferase family 2 protein n=1 Tax=Crossiella sp. SN42 TaxID=2944808 RepID=UPI00207CC47C|nr:glycosyltransferase [Crossiella sp. SN42]MCO1576306.1 glycosyltransferase [Crossiella sp. SN42]
MSSTVDYAVVVPTIGRASLWRLLNSLANAHGPQPAEVIVVDDRPNPEPLGPTPIPVRVLTSGGRGPAAARNVGWRATECEWIAFLDDDVVVSPDWPERLAADLARLDAKVAASKAKITVPLPTDRAPTDAELGTAGLAQAEWITADMAYRRSALAEVGGFDERFPRAYREDAELALRVMDQGLELTEGERSTTHPVREQGFLASVRAQRGNTDDALLRHLVGAGWRERIGGQPGRLRWHVVTTGALVAAVGFGLAGLRRGGTGAGALAGRRAEALAGLRAGALSRRRTTAFVGRRAGVLGRSRATTLISKAAGALGGSRATTLISKAAGALGGTRATALVGRRAGAVVGQLTSAVAGPRAGANARRRTAALVGALAARQTAAGPGNPAWPRRAALVAGLVWAGLTAEFAARRIRPGPRTPDEIARMVVTSVIIPPMACLHRLRGELRFWRVRR